MVLPDDQERVYPSYRVVVDIVDATEGASEDEIINCLNYLRNERGLRPGSKNGPQHFSWFKTVVADYFVKKRNREFVINPARGAHKPSNSSGLSRLEFDRMTEAF